MESLQFEALLKVVGHCQFVLLPNKDRVASHELHHIRFETGRMNSSLRAKHRIVIEFFSDLSGRKYINGKAVAILHRYQGCLNVLKSTTYNAQSVEVHRERRTCTEMVVSCQVNQFPFTGFAGEQSGHIVLPYQLLATAGAGCPVAAATVAAV